MPTHLLQIAKKLAHDAGKMALKIQKRGFTVDHKDNSSSNLVTEADRLCEEFLIKNIKLHFPDHNILSEEAGLLEGGGDYKWIIDPIDGTSNFAQGIPIFAISLALIHRGKPIIGVIDLPGLGEQFWAMEGKGAYKGMDRIHVSKTHALENAMLATGFPFDRSSPHFKKNIALFEAFYRESRGVRRMGSAATDLCFVACGRFDGFWEYDLKPWDFAAGKIILEEAGGVITNMDGSTLNPKLGKLLASNGSLHQAMLNKIRSEKGDE